ncbi:MAG: hypothetical protein KatS3mg061_0645 [Dehalococcoidia bacterium]|nr:MAG: hypothetical protein KatS3mg061_0645 [Dehalococcoidia bacterium]
MRAPLRSIAKLSQRFPLGLPGCHRDHLHEGRERLVQPDAIPPPHRDEVPEPHVRQFMSDYISDALEFWLAGRLLID